MNAYIRSRQKELQNRIDKSKEDKKIFLFCAPIHSNLGDQAQLMCWLRLFKEWYPNHKVICISTRLRTFSTIRSIRKVINKDDLLFIHSGYLVFDPHPELPFICDIVRAFYDYKITILPQTVNLKDEWIKNVVIRCFNSHPNLTLMCRDEISYSKAQKMFENVTCLLMPDVVTSLIGSREFKCDKVKRNGILFCIRNDGEKYYTDKQINDLRHRFGGVSTEIKDTTIKCPIWKMSEKRESLIINILKSFAQYQLIITDRYHGTIFSQIVNTPVVVLSSTDHKLSSGVKWFPNNLFGQNVFFAKNLDEAYKIAIEILSRKGRTTENPSWFKDEYYAKEIY